MVQCFFTFLPIRIFKMFADSINNNTLISHPDNKRITVCEVIQYIAMRMQIISTGQKDDLKDYFTLKNKKPSPYKKEWWLSRNRFQFLHSHLKVNIYKLADELSKQSANMYKPSQVVAIDESIFSYLGKDSPFRHLIPRKSHPLGHLAYLLTSKSLKYGLTFIHCILPMASKKKMSMRDIIEYFSKWSRKYRLPIKHFIFDSAFMTVKVVNDLRMKGIYCTGSVKSFVCKFIWEMLGEEMTKLNCGRTYLSNDGIMFTLIRMKDDEGKLKVFRSISTSFETSANQSTMMTNKYDLEVESEVKRFIDKQILSIAKMKAKLISEISCLDQLQVILNEQKKSLRALKKTIRQREIAPLTIVSIDSCKEINALRMYKARRSDGSFSHQHAHSLFFDGMPIIAFIKYAQPTDYKLYVDKLESGELTSHCKNLKLFKGI